jgi:hypothetical protein
MKLNLQIVTARQGCFPGLEWWEKKFGDSPVEYQAVLDALAQEDRVDWARWLMNAIGSDDSVGRLDETRSSNAFFAGDLVDDMSFVIRGTLLVAGKCDVYGVTADQIVVGRSIRAGTLRVDGNVTALAGDIFAADITAENIRAGENIMAGHIRCVGTVRAVGDIRCADMKAASVVPYATGLRPDPPRQTASSSTPALSTRQKAERANKAR